EGTRHQHALFALLQPEALGNGRLGDVLDLHAEIAALDDAVLEQLLHDVLRQVGRDRQADALEAPAARLDRRADADHLTFQADERAAGVARVDRRIGLEKVLVHVHAQAAALAADNAVRHRADQSERRADREHAIADLHLFAVAQLQVRQVVLCLDADDGKVAFRVGLDVLGREFATVLQLDGHLVGSLDNVVVGKDDALGVNEETGAEAETARAVTGVLLRLVVLEEAAKLLGDAGVDLSPFAAAVAPGPLRLRLDTDNGRQHALDDVAVGGQLLRDGGRCADGLLSLKDRAGRDDAEQGARQEEYDRDGQSFHDILSPRARKGRFGSRRPWDRKRITNRGEEP